MGKGKNTKTPNSKNKSNVSWTNGYPRARNLVKDDLGAVIFGCKHHTFLECVNKKIFGLPAEHYSYVRNITPGLTLFLFNYSDRRLHGIFEAKSSGQLHMDKSAWAESEGAVTTPYAAQVRVDDRKKCQPLLEKEFKPLIEKNYYTERLFRFELDKRQADQLIKLFLSSSFPEMTSMPPRPIPGMAGKMKENVANILTTTADASQLENKCAGLLGSTPSYDEARGPPLDAWHCLENAGTESGEVDCWEEDAIADHYLQETRENADLHSQSDTGPNMQFHEWAVEGTEPKAMPSQTDSVDRALVESPNSLSAGVLTSTPSSYFESVIVKMTQEIEGLKIDQLKQRLKMHSMEQELREMIRLKNMCSKLETMASFAIDRHEPEVCDVPEGNVLVVGGYDGTSWLSDLCSYSPSQDTVVPLCPMTFARSYSAVAKLNGELYVFGGSYEGVWDDTVESYNPLTNQWVKRPSLKKRKGGVAGGSLYDTIFAMGGWDGVESFSEVEVLDGNTGCWISTQSMLEKRFGAAAAVMNGSLYVAGGYDGKEYLSSVERFDPRQHAWSRVASMNSKRGFHSLDAYKEDLYAIGGYDGDTDLSTVEVFDPRVGSWMMAEPMKVPRANFGSFVLGGKIYVIGGMKGTEVLDVIECYESEAGWQVKGSTILGKRSFFSAVVM